MQRFELNLVSKYRSEVYGISTLWIMLFHGYLVGVSYFKNIVGLSLIGSIIKIGNMGVEIFLCLSGICLYYSFAKDTDTVNFYRKRATRVLLSVLFIDGLYWLFLLCTGEISFVSFVIRFTTLTFWFTGDQQIWFVSLIVVSYLLYPFIYAFIYREPENKKKTLINASLLFLSSICFPIILSKVAPTYYAKVEIAITRLPVFIIGCYLGKIVYSKRTLSKTITPLMVLLVTLCFVVLKIGSLHSYLRRFWYMVGGIPLTFLFAWIIQFVPRLLRKAFSALGAISLECYLTQIVLIMLYQNNYLPYKYASGNVIHYIFTMILSVLSAYCFSRVIHLIKQRVPIFS